MNTTIQYPITQYLSGVTRVIDMTVTCNVFGTGHLNRACVTVQSPKNVHGRSVRQVLTADEAVLLGHQLVAAGTLAAAKLKYRNSTEANSKALAQQVAKARAIT